MFYVLLTLWWRPAKPNVLASFPTAIFRSSSNVLPNAEHLSASRLQVGHSSCSDRKRNWDYLSISTKRGWHFFQLACWCHRSALSAQYSVLSLHGGLRTLSHIGIIFEGEPYGHFGCWLPLKGANLNSQTCVVFSWYSTNIPLRTVLSGGDHHLPAPLGPTRTTPEPSALLKTPNLATTTPKCNQRVIDPSPHLPTTIHRDPTSQAPTPPLWFRKQDASHPWSLPHTWKCFGAPILFPIPPFCEPWRKSLLASCGPTGIDPRYNLAARRWPAVPMGSLPHKSSWFGLPRPSTPLWLGNWSKATHTHAFLMMPRPCRLPALRIIDRMTQSLVGHWIVIGWSRVW